MKQRLVRYARASYQAARLAAAYALIAHGVCHAGKVDVWRHDSKADFEPGRRDGAVISEGGAITLGPRIKSLADLRCGSVWDLARVSGGQVLAATAMPGQVVAVADDGATRVLWTDERSQAFAVVALADGSALVGTGPHGVVLKVAADGSVSEHARCAAMYVWDLAAASNGEVFAATGPDGKVFRISDDGRCELFHETRQQHVLGLAVGAMSDLLVCTDRSGLVLAIDGASEGRVVYDARESEVRSLAACAGGVVLAGTASANGGRSASDGSTRTGPARSSTNHVYRLSANGGVQTVLETNSSIYAISRYGRGDASRIVAGLGAPAAITTLDEEGRGSVELARFDPEQVLCLLPCADGSLLIGHGNPGKVSYMAPAHAERATFLSPPLDAKMTARFGAVSWLADVPNGSGVSLAVRSGNIETPDDTWSAWSHEMRDPAQATAAGAPAARFLQYRLALSTSVDAAPIVRSVDVRYQTVNQPPRISSVTVPHVDRRDGGKPLSELELEWDVEDSNDDDMTFRVRVRKVEWNRWLTLADALDEPTYSWDLTTAAEGTYLAEVTATDLPSNTPADKLEATITSEPFLVDRTAPRVKIARVAPEKRRPTFSIQAVDAWSTLVAAEYSLDSGPWTALVARDGLLDRREERFRVALDKIEPGAHVLVVRARDAAGFAGYADMAFEIGD